MTWHRHSEPDTPDPDVGTCEGVQRELQRLAVHRNGVVFVAGLWASAAFWTVLRIPTEAFAPYLWPFLFGSTAILTVAVLAHPESRRLHWWLTVVGLTTIGLRPSVSLTKWLLLGTSTVADVGFACSIYALAGFLWIRFSQSSLRAWRYHAIASAAGGPL